MKVLFIAPYFFPALGGLENYVLNIALGLKQAYNAEIVVVTADLKHKKQVIDDCCGIKVYRLPAMMRISNTPVNPLWYFSLQRIIREEKPEIINSHQPVMFLGDLSACLAGNIPFILTYHSGTMRKQKLLPDIITFLYEKLILPYTAGRANRIICASNFIENTILKNYATKSTVIHPGVDISLFKPDPTIKKEDNLILFICRYKSMYEIKGLYYLLDAIKDFSNIKVHIIGEKTDFADERFVSVGVKRGKDLVAEMQKASVVVLPSFAVEGFGMVLIEALACQTPVIGTNRGGIPEAISDGIDGLIVPTNDSHALGRAISSILADKKLATRMGHVGAAKVRERFTWETRVALTKGIFEACLK